MGIFDLFKTKKPIEVSDTSWTDTPAEDTMTEDGDSRFRALFVDDSDPNTRRGNKMPIYDLYDRLEEDYDNKGYNDAMRNPESNYKDKQKIIIISGIRVLCSKIRTMYEDRIEEVGYHLSVMKSNGFIETVNRMEKDLKLLNQHLEKLTELEKEIENQDGYYSFILKTYEQGFLRGLAEYSKQEVNKINNQ